jgi:tRNA (cmo5U34)-methyltransferase
MNSRRDAIFETEDKVEDFAFNDVVAGVFDDMVRRSVPFYDEVQRMVAEMGAAFLSHGGIAYDIGCSTGNTIAAIAAQLPDTSRVRFVGIDPSGAMLEQAREKLAPLQDSQRLELIESDIQRFNTLKDARLVTILYTLQFVRPMERSSVLKMVRRSLVPGGCLILAEKVLADEAFARRLYIDLYHRYKNRQGYSELEIAKKREALENVLIPFHNRENIQLLRDAGFEAVEQAFRWYNFSLYVATAR